MWVSAKHIYSNRQTRTLALLCRYKAAGATYVDADGSTDVSEFINVSKDDAMAYPEVAHRVYPPTVNTYMKDTIRPFIQTCVTENRVLLGVFNDKLGLPKDTLLDLHDHTKRCLSESRCIKVPAAPKDTKIALGRHTDVGRWVCSALRCLASFSHHTIAQYFISC